ncbi:MAG TPA: DUF4412 domain-containing protein [Rhodopila sp.]|nr:DUF4412 domain-containing protein [Rhodopila sp.]
MGTTGLVAALLLVSGIAQAETGPKLIPTRDVDITYRVTRPNEQPFKWRVRWNAGSAMERVDGPGGSVVLVNHKTHDETLLNSKTRTYVKVDVPSDNLLDQAPDAPVTRQGNSRIAGLSCTDWAWTDNDDQQPHTICVTEDGVRLREIIAGKTVMLAKSVKYRKLKGKMFEIPSDYEPSLSPSGAQGTSTD